MIKPILFNTEMVKAILDGRKMQTRRVAFVADALREFSCASYPDGWWYKGRVYKSFESFVRDCQTPKCKYSPGDILWVREAYCEPYAPGKYSYRADYEQHDVIPNPVGNVSLSANMFRWKPSIHMPKQAARIFLRVNGVWMERLKDICDKYEYGPDHPVAKEGFTYTCDFIATWENTIKPADRDKYGWNANPWVWVIEFERCEKPEGWV